MIKRRLTVLLIEDNPEYAELVQRWLALTSDFEFGLTWSNSLMSGLNQLAKGGVDAILLDLGMPDSEGMTTFTTARVHAVTVPIIVLSGVDTESMALQMVQQGAQDYLVKSACTSALLIKSLQYAVSRTSQAALGTVTDQGTVIGVLGAKGGSGSTTFACNLATELRRQTDQTTLLADLDFSSGMVSFLMNTEAQFSILDAVAGIQCLDPNFWKRRVAHGPAGVDLVRSPNVLAIDEAETEKVLHVLTLIQALYRWTILDLGRLSVTSMALLPKVNELCLVTRVNIPALYEAKRVIGMLLDAGIEAGRLRLIVNDGGLAQEFSSSELGRLFGIPVCAKLPNATQELHDACTQGKLLGAQSQYRLEVAGLARKLAGLPEETHASRVTQLKTFADRFRRAHREESLDAALEERLQSR